MPNSDTTRAPSSPELVAGINWESPEAPAIDGFTVAEIVEMVVDSLIPARCTACGGYAHVEPDAEGYDCAECGASATVTSPLVKLGFV